MEIGDWITLTAVLVALGLGIAALVQTQLLQQRVRKERLINEIIEWSEHILKIEYLTNIDYTKLGGISNELQEHAFIYDSISKIAREFENIKQKSLYIEKVAQLLSKEIFEDVTQLKKCVFDYIEEFDYILGTSDREKEYRGKLKYNSPDANDEIRRRILVSKEKLFSKADEIEAFAQKIVGHSIILRSKI